MKGTRATSVKASLERLARLLFGIVPRAAKNRLIRGGGRPGLSWTSSG